MALTVRAAQVRTPRVRLDNVSIAASSYRPLYMSRDRTTVYAANGRTLHKSTDDGATWTVIFTAPQTDEKVTACLELDDGRLLVASWIYSQRARLYRSSLAGGGGTWTQMISNDGVLSQFHPFWNLTDSSFDGNGHLWLSEYGTQTSTSGDQSDKGRRIWRGNDDGSSFTLMFDLLTYAETVQGLTVPTQTAGLHLHAAAYDKWDNRVWFTMGDDVGAGPDVVTGGANGYNAQIGYTDDNFATVNWLPLPAFWGNTREALQVVSILPLENAVIFASDGRPNGLLILPRRGYRTYGSLKIGAHNSLRHTYASLSQGLTRAWNRPDLPALAAISLPNTAGQGAATLFAGLDGGLTWEELYRFPTGVQTTLGGFVGPTINGKVLAFVNDGATKILTADLVIT